ncbi:hypothetical protein [Herbiconiux flava]|uniref:Glycosyltransferase RgtA/B/C/D-like domain-containing protein n=1 Tax=Herbiconiux flava TaxID=881268 RepID=A0A852SUD7_9MICO|nr:hypothetical protein [Herbiconiux flava]NYD72352.1 hypothetical protein [Herbiconiux flava]GLK17685.1 hypothetical protein GCM10017602_21670 [Herbiconiux flava]
MTDSSPRTTPSGRVDAAVDRGVRSVQHRLRAVSARLNPDVVAAIALAAVVLIAAAVVFSGVRTQYFIYDEFDYLAPPDGANWLRWIITPHNEHTILFTKVWFSLLYQTVGLQGYWLYALPMLICHLAGGVAVYALLRLVVPSRAVCVAVVAPVLIMAAGAGTVTWAGQFQYTAATAAGLWVLYLALSPRVGPRLRVAGVVALSLFGTFSGSAYIPLGVAAGLALVSLRRYLLGAIAIAVPAIWFVVVRVVWTIPSYNSAHSLDQVLRDGPEFVYALLAKAVNDSIPVADSFTPAVLVVAIVGVLAYLAVRPGPLAGSRARRTYLFLLVALVLSLAITLIGRLSRDVAESASGGYSYFILIVAIPVFVASLARFVTGTRIAVAVLVLLLGGWAAINIVALGDEAEGLSDWKSGNAALLGAAASLSDDGLIAVSDDAVPSPQLAPTVSWAELSEMAADDRIVDVEPSALNADQVSLNVQWTGLSTPVTGELTSCEAIAPHTSIDLPATAQVALAPVGALESTTVVTLAYPTSAASIPVGVDDDGTLLASTADRPSVVTAGDTAVTACR